MVRGRLFLMAKKLSNRDLHHHKCSVRPGCEGSLELEIQPFGRRILVCVIARVYLSILSVFSLIVRVIRSFDYDSICNI